MYCEYASASSWVTAPRQILASTAPPFFLWSCGSLRLWAPLVDDIVSDTLLVRARVTAAVGVDLETEFVALLDRAAAPSTTLAVGA